MGKLGELWHRRRASRLVALVAVAALVPAACAGGGRGGDGGEAAGPAEQEQPPAEWLRVGLDLANTRAVTGETALDVHSVAVWLPPGTCGASTA